ncbi:MAG: hemerythrin domain-containing protein [Rhodoferax sp.]|jgi:hemerythrin-like metal-binding protein|nr:hemerythrin domain-containing protein [Rhodoferax sp.]
MATTDSNASDPIQWGDEFLLGYGPIDGVHEEFVDLLGRLQGATDTELPALLDQFAAHCTAHFEMENGWMLETEFPPRECHIDEHAAVLASVHEVQGLLAEGNVGICRELVAQLADWFPKHADQLDSALAHWMTKKRLGGKPVVVRRGLKLR